MVKKKSNQDQVLRQQIGDIFIEFGQYLKDGDQSHYLRAEDSGLVLDDFIDDGDIQVGNRIKSLRKEAELSQLELAAKLEISQAELSKLESGGKILSMSRAKALTEIFKSSIDYLLTGKMEKQIENRPRHKRSKAG